MTRASVTRAGTPMPAELRLRARIGWICRIVRGAALLYPLWLALVLGAFWMDDRAIRSVYPGAGDGAAAALSPGARLAGLAVAAGVWGLVVGSCLCVWRLFSLYAKGRVFSAEAAGWMRRVGQIGLLALAADIAARPLLAWILDAGGWPRIGPSDLMLGLLFVGVLALAEVFRAAAEIAEDHAQFV